jgi:hypothetical protein
MLAKYQKWCNAMADICARTTKDVVAEIKMSLAAFSGVHLLIEGGPDSIFWRLRLSHPAQCQLVICGNKGVVVSSIVELDRTAQRGMLGIIDDDFDSILGISYASSNLLATDTHDLETMMIGSRALNAILVEYGDPDKIKHFVAIANKSVVEALIENSLVFGRLRLLNARNGWGVDCTKFSPWKYVSLITWQVDTTTLFADFATQIDVAPLVVQNAVASEVSSPPWNIIQGHDAVNILAIGLRSVLATKQVGERELTRSFRLSYDSDMFQSTALFALTSAWAAKNNLVVV